MSVSHTFNATSLVWIPCSVWAIKALLFSLATTSEYRCSVYTYSFTFCPHIICSAFILWFCYISGYRWISFKLESHCTIWAFWIRGIKYKPNWHCIHPRNRYRNKAHSVLRYSNWKTCICIISTFCCKIFWKIYDRKLLAILCTTDRANLPIYH